MDNKEIWREGQPLDPAKEFDEKELLVRFEQAHIPPHYKSYYMTKRHNLFATIQQFAYLWDCQMVLDKVLAREFEMMTELRNPNLMFPMVCL